MKPLSALSADDVADLRGLIFDLDGTVVTDGKLSRAAFGALHALHDAGLRLVLCTGRPAAWVEPLVRQWPIDLAVAENGPIAYHQDGGRVLRIDRLSPAQRGRRRAALLAVVEQLRGAHPEMPFADDNLGRLADITFDIGEHTQVDKAVREAFCATAADLGAVTFESSIHLHVSLDQEDKASGTVHALTHAFDEDATAAIGGYGFVGDSANDAACFSAFGLSFGVANLRKYIPELTVLPHFISDQSAGAGFVAIAERILELR